MKLTEEFLVKRGFKLHWDRDHNYRSQFTLYFDNVDRAISLISVQDFGLDTEYTKFDIWFWGRAANSNNYAEVDSHLQISTVEEFESLMKLLKDD